MTTTKPEAPNATIADLAAQPIGYWSWATHKAVIRYIRSSMARIGITQPQWWILFRVGSAEGGMSRQELRDLLSPTLDEGPDAIDRALDSAVALGWLTATAEETYVLTDAGREMKERTWALVGQVRGEMHAGITDEEYAAALSVLRRMIVNVGADELLR
ncbi:MarR family winged helix-turn-helix transcriptional regulator [Streptomyces sp. NPDC049577]|uniref:MarR family winged helix-turn-helix transcriptional regulator n=1 Tax=Streptomyces sp. NPDC049577 TaxID=3155153 RepID=UPI0034212F39